MGTSELILSIDPTVIDLLLLKGVLYPTVKRDVSIYTFYKSECETTGCMQARTNTAEKFFLCEDMISRIIRKMK